MNYLTFDQKNFTGSAVLTVNQSSVLTGIQDLIVNEVIPRYSYDDYTAPPQGPMAIMLRSVDMPGPLNYIRDKMNSLIFQSNVNAENNLKSSLSKRIDVLLGKALSKSGQQVSASSIDDLRKTLNVPILNTFSTNLWSMDPKNPDEVGQNLIKALDLLKKNVDSLKGKYIS